MRTLVALPFAVLLISLPLSGAEDQKVSIRFQAMVGDQRLACGQSYAGIGKTNSTISPRDFRFYVHGVELIDDSGGAVPVTLDQDGKWQLDDVALLDFENGTGGCVNGTPDLNDRVNGTVAAGHYVGLRFVLGVPFNKNHTDLTKMPPPLNLTALAWVWNAGRKFARLDFSSSGQPRGFAVHLGSTGCTPNDTKITIPTQCSSPNRTQVEFAAFNVATDVAIADLAMLLKEGNVDVNQPDTAGGCMSSPDDSDCGPLFATLGLPFGNQPVAKQTFFRVGSPAASTAHR